MKTPNKIYYHKGALRTAFALNKQADDTDKEYVSKDVLLKWISQQRYKASLVGSKQYQSAFDILERKIKSM